METGTMGGDSLTRLVRAVKDAPGVSLSGGRTAIILTEELRLALREADIAQAENHVPARPGRATPGPRRAG